MFALIGNMVACMLWGAFLSFVLVVLLYGVVRVLWSSATLSLPSSLVLLVVWAVLFFQGTLLVGAMYAKGYVGDVVTWVSTLSVQMEDASGRVLSSDEVNQFKQKLAEEYPLLSSSINKVEVPAFTSGNVAFAMANGVKKQINGYMLRRVLWMAGCMLVGGILLGCFRPRYKRMPVDWDTI